MSSGWRYAVAAILGLALSSCGGSAAQDGADVTVFASSSLRAAVVSELIPAFRRTAAGKGVELAVVSGPSAARADAAISGDPPDIVLLSTMADMGRLIDAGVVGRRWPFDNPHGDLLAASVAALVVRAGNPKRIRGWDDLARQDVRVVFADPARFAEGQWGALALAGSREEPGGSRRDGRRFLERVLGAAEIEPRGPATALRRLAAGDADVLVGYESQALQAEAAGAAVEHLVPEPSIVVEHPLAVTRNASPAARRFLDFVGTDRAQRLLVRQGLRPASVEVYLETRRRFPQPELYTVSTLDGWASIEPRFFDVRSGIVPRVLAATRDR